MKLRSNTANCLVLGELGKHNITKSIEKRIIGFWIRLVHGKSSKFSFIIFEILKMLYEKNIYISPWIKNVKRNLDNLGLSYLWHDCPNINVSYLNALINQRLNDMYTQKWHEKIETNSLCLNYRIFKQYLYLEKYLIKLPFRYRMNLCKFRCGNHRLPVVTGRYYNIDRKSRVCTLQHLHHLHTAPDTLYI